MNTNTETSTSTNNVDEDFVELPNTKTRVLPSFDTKDKEKPDDYVRVPKIYYTSRTQKQLSQVVKELRQNTIHTPRMTILGSRNHYCINPRLKHKDNKNEECDRRLKEEGCRYFHGVRLMSRPKGVWDIEDLCKLGQQRKGCPYYFSRSLAETADIIFCPYNYIIDPSEYFNGFL